MRIVHIGTGAFHRAHQAWHVARANAATGSDWRIDGVSLRSAAVRDAMAADGYRYALEIADADGRRVEVLDLIESVLVAPEDPGAVADLIARPETALVTLTVTEKGYHLRADGSPDDAARADAARLKAGETPEIYRAVASLQRVMLLGSQMDAGERAATLETLSAEGAPFRPLALEQRALMHFERGETAAALNDLQTALALPDTPEALRGRARQLVIAAGGTVDAAALAPGGAGAATATDG